MASKLNTVLVIDVEATCWAGVPPEGQQNEIIEIGICVVDVKSGLRLGKQSLLVKPEYSQVSPFCTELTGLTQDMVDQGISFRRACMILQRKYTSRDRVWASYGDYDRRQFEKQCQEQNIPYPFGSTHLNVKSLFALIFALPREVGLLRALELLDVRAEGVHHRGVDDAWNTGLILSKLILSRRAQLGPAAE